MAQPEQNPDGTAVRPAALDLRVLHREIAAIIDSADTPETKSLKLIELVVRLTNAAAGVLFHRGGDGAIAAGARYLSRQSLTWSDALLGELAQQADSALEGSVTKIGTLQRKDDARVITVPVSGKDGPSIALTVVLVTGDQALEQFVAVVALSAIILARSAQTPPGATDDQLWAFFSELQLACGDPDPKANTARVLALLERDSGADTAFLGLGRNGVGVEVHYPAHHPATDGRGELPVALERAFHEILTSTAPLKYGERGDIDGTSSIVLRDIASVLHAGFVLGVATPETVPGGGRLAVILTWQDKSAARADRLGLFERKLTLARISLAGVGKQTPRGGLLARALRHKFALIATVGIIAALMAVPVSYRIGADATLVPIERRTVVAPFDATLGRAYFEPGDVVAAGDVLAQLDGKELLLEIEGTTAELEKMRNRRRSALATGKTTEAQLAKFEMDKLDAALEVLRQRRERIELHSPIDGVLLAGDLKRNTGSPLRTGQALFEIAPLDTLLAEIQIPDHAIAHVRAGMPVALKFEALTRTERSGTLAQVRPRAEIVNQRNVFVGETELDNTDAALKPGMTARAKITGDKHALGWVLFHRAWQRLRIILW